jgi:UDP-3-O-[3-hydroxymyristoyl] N-acetylglucosamine deacetylase
VNSPSNQKTLSKSVSFKGKGIHSGQEVSLTLHPAPSNFGIIFQPIDKTLVGGIPATLEYIVSTGRSTNLGKDGIMIHTVEHLLAALYAFEITNLLVEFSGSEMPIGDGSSLPFLQLIQEAGIAEQNSPQKIFVLKEPVFWSEGETHLVALPLPDSSPEDLQVSYTLNYPGHPLLDSQYFSFKCSSENFTSQIASARTFSLYEEVQMLLERGLIKGGSLDNAVVIQGVSCLNPEGLRFPNEMVRHKILDLVGDLSLLGYRLKMHIIAIRSGHPSHFQLAKKLSHHLTAT